MILLAHFSILAGFIIGLGAVTVIDLHGFLGRKSPYWNEATIRTHKITKPLIWVGMMLSTVGFIFLYQQTNVPAYALLQSLIALILIANGCFLSFWISPRLLERERTGRGRELLPTRWQYALTVSFLLSFAGWWSNVALYAWWISAR